MATIAQLRARSDELFTELLNTSTAARRARARGVTAKSAPAFSWFDPDQAVGAAALSLRLSALAASRKRVNEALASALNHVVEARGREHPEQVRQGFALFVTHNHAGRRLAKPRTVSAAPRLFNPPDGRSRSMQRRLSVGGLSPGLDYWREDALMNEHHQHWHEVYPYTGLPPRSFTDWLSQHSAAELVAILEELAPADDWATRVANATETQLAGLFAQVLQADAVRALPPDLYKALFRLNDRQGELFFYMHQQMLARYDSELLSNGLARVEPFGPSAWTKPIAAGHDPIGLAGFGRREPNERLEADAVGTLRALVRPIDEALGDGRLRGAGGAAVAIDRVTLGEAVEASIGQLSGLDAEAYPGLHNFGHVLLAALSAPNRGGVMNSTVTAIRDQIFWQWHRYVDDISAKWQETQDPYGFRDAPKVLLRNGLAAGDQSPWASPDIILCRSADLPTGSDPAQLGQQLFGGERWTQDFASAQAAGALTVTTLDELLTLMGKVNLGGRTVEFLTHEPFSYFVRVENRSTKPADVTLRIFLAPADLDSDRRCWMELDKFTVRLAARSKTVVYRPDSESSVVKRPAETSPADVLAGGGDPDENSYCDCGWPYTLLLPRGTSEGMAFRLLVMCTDATVDRIDAPEHCGSMSYCGAVERYPDERDMGYPFSRPFNGPKATAIRDTIVGLPSAAARTITIRHV